MRSSERRRISSSCSIEAICELDATQLFVLELEDAPVVELDLDVPALARETGRHPLDRAARTECIIWYLAVADLRDFDALAYLEILCHGNSLDREAGGEQRVVREAPGRAQETERAHVLEPMAERGMARECPAADHTADPKQARFRETGDRLLPRQHVAVRNVFGLHRAQHAFEGLFREPRFLFGACPLELLVRPHPARVLAELRARGLNRRLHDAQDHRREQGADERHRRVGHRAPVARPCDPRRGEVLEHEPVALRRDHAVPVPFGEQLDALRSVPRHTAHVEHEPVRLGLPFGESRCDHERRHPGTGAEVLLPGQPPRLAVAARCRLRLRDVAAGSRLGRDRSEPVRPCLLEEQVALRMPRIRIPIRNLRRREPERQHRRVHRGHERDGRVRVDDRSQDLGDVARGRPDVVPDATELNGDTGQRETGVTKGGEVGGIERAPRLAGRSIRSPRFRYPGDAFVDVRRVHDYGAMFWLYRNMFVGSYFFLSSTKRSYFGPKLLRTRAFPSSPMKLRYAPLDENGARSCDSFVFQPMFASSSAESVHTEIKW